MDLSFLDLSLVLLAIAIGLAYFVFATFLFGAGYQPTPKASVEMMLRFAELTPNDTLYDLGAGTGAIVFRAARVYRAHVVGVEVEPIRFLVLRARRALGPFPDLVTLLWGDLYRLDFHGANVVTAFLWPGAMARLRPKFEAELPPGARIVSHCHPVPGWVPVAQDPSTKVYLYRRPDAGPPAAGPTSTGGG